MRNTAILIHLTPFLLVKVFILLLDNSYSIFLIYTSRSDRQIVTMPKEIITLQIGTLSNFVGTHFWNAQVCTYL